MPSFFDTHCHLQDDRLRTNMGAVVARARAAGVERMLCCGTTVSDWQQVVDIAATYPGVLPAVGIHPWYMAGRPADWLERMRQVLDDTGCAVGEIGLDHAVDPRNDEEQWSVFMDQLRLARELHRPVSIHCRRAWESLLNALREVDGLPDGGVVHSFAGSPEMVSALVEYGCSFSYSGSITRPGNRRSRKSLVAVPLDRLVIETDAPDIVPEGAPGAVNEPSYIPLVAAAVADVRGMSAAEAAELTWRNATRIFGG